MLDVTEQLRRYGDAVAETVDPVPVADVTDMTTGSRPPRRPVWQPLVAATVGLVVLVGGVWFATRSSDTSPSLITAGDEIEVGVATVLLPDGMKLDRFGEAEPPGAKVWARLTTPTGACTITSSGIDLSVLRKLNNLAVERYTSELSHLAQVRTTLERRIADLDRQIASGSDQAPSLVLQRDAALKQVESAAQAQYALQQRGPERPPTGAELAPTDASRTTWLALLKPTAMVLVTCADAATAEQLVDATTLPVP